QALVNQIVEAAYRERYGDQWHLHLQNQHLTPLEIRRKPVASSQSTSRDTSPGASSHYSGTTMNEHAEGSKLNTPSPSSSRPGSQSPHRSEHEGSSGQADPSTTFVDGSNHSHVVNAGNNMHPYAAIWPVSYDPPPYTAHRPLSVISEEGTGQTAVQTAARRALLLAAQKQVVPVVVNKNKKLKYEPAPLNHLTRGTMRKKVMGTYDIDPSRSSCSILPSQVDFFEGPAGLPAVPACTKSYSLQPGLALVELFSNESAHRGLDSRYEVIASYFVRQ
ncbi:uncharacterized protein CLUP02_04943, partial [Colletotrichum lupini]